MIRPIRGLPWRLLTWRERWRRATYPIRYKLDERRAPKIEATWEHHDPVVRVEIWTDGSVFIDGDDGSLDFANLKTNNRADAEAWLKAALLSLKRVGTPRG